MGAYLRQAPDLDEAVREAVARSLRSLPDTTVASTHALAELLYASSVEAAEIAERKHLHRLRRKGKTIPLRDDTTSPDEDEDDE